jgi:ribosome-binding factor A
MSSIRQNKVADRIRDVIAESLTGDLLRDPRLKGVTVTKVEVSGDLQIAKIYFTSYLDEHSEVDMQKALKGCAGFFRKELASALFMRRIPTMNFYYDKSLEQQNQIERLFDKINKEPK